MSTQLGGDLGQKDNRGEEGDSLRAFTHVIAWNRKEDAATTAATQCEQADLGAERWWEESWFLEFEE